MLFVRGLYGAGVLASAGIHCKPLEPLLRSPRDPPPQRLTMPLESCIRDGCCACCMSLIAGPLRTLSHVAWRRAIAGASAVRLLSPSLGRDEVPSRMERTIRGAGRGCAAAGCLPAANWLGWRAVQMWCMESLQRRHRRIWRPPSQAVV